MTSNFSKKVLIEQGELDRLQQRQLRDYSPELQSMARLQNHIRNIMSRKNLFAEERLNLISGEQIQFDKLKKETGVLSGALPAQAAPAPQPPTPAVLHKVQVEKGIGSDIASENEEENLEEEEKFEEEPAPGSGLSPHLKTVIRWNIDGLYQAKARRLLKGLQKTKVSWIELNLGKLWYMGKQFREVILNRSLLPWSAGDRTCARWVLMNFSAHYGASAS